MKIARFAMSVDGAAQVAYGLVSGLDEHDEPTADSIVSEITSHPFAPPELTGVVHPLAAVRLLAPVLPSKVVAVAKNYADHAAEMGGEVPPEPMIFLKPSTSVIGPGDAVRLPWQSAQVEHEAELAVVVGRLCRDVPVERVPEVVLGYTCADDVTARDLQRTDGQWGRAKGFDTFCPLGPWIDTDLDPSDALVVCAVGDDLRQRASTATMVRDVPALVSWISSVMTLLPGDVILTGTPAGVGPLAPGDDVAISIDGIGTLSHTVLAREEVGRG